MKFSKLVNCLKGVACGVLVWVVLFGLLRMLGSWEFFRPLWRPMRFLILVFGPVTVYPPLLWVILRYQLPPLSSRYIKKHWPLWVPGFVVSCLPSVDFLILGKRLIRLITG